VTCAAFAASSGSANYIQAQGTTPGTAQNTNFNIGTGTGIATTFNATSSILLNGNNINTGGTLSNVAYKDQANSFSAANTFMAANALTLGTTGSNNGGIVFRSSNAGSNTITLQALTTLGATARTITLPDGSGTVAVSASGALSLSATTGALTVADAVSNGSTKGVASFTAADFNDASGNISIDYTNGQAASGSTKGFLTAADWTTFNGKLSAEADTLQSVIARGATATSAASFTGGATIRGLTVDTATATDDLLVLSVTTGGAGRFTGTITSTDLTGNQTYTLPNATGTILTTGNLSAITATGTIGSGTWQGSVITDTYINDTLTIGSGSTVDWTALNNYPTACSAGNAITALGDTVTCAAFAASSGSANYIQAQGTTPGTAQNTNFNIGTGTGIATTFNATSSILLNGNNINTGGTLSNVAYKDQANSFSAANTFMAANALTLGTTGSNNGGIVFRSSNAGSNTITLQALTTLGATARTITLPDGSGTVAVSASGALSLSATTGALTVADAVSNGSTKGVASFTAADFNDASGNISIDYTNGQAASGSTKGFLTAADWTTFNGKLSAEADTLQSVIARGATATSAASFTGGATIRGLTVDTATATDDLLVLSVTTGGAGRFTGTITSTDLTANRSYTLPNASGTFAVSASAPLALNATTGALTIADAVSNGSTKGAASFTAADFNDASGNISLDYANGQAASGSAKGFLTSADWTTFNGKLSAEADTLQSVIGRGATATSAATFNGGATIRGLTVDNATANDDRILITSAALGSGTRFDGTITNANLTAARTYTLQDNSGIIPLATAANSLFFTTSGATSLTLPTTGTVCTTATCLTSFSEADTLQSVTTRGATTTTASSFTGGATIRGLTVDTATATDDLLVLSVTAGGAGRFTGTITSTDLTANRTYTLPNETGTICTTGSVCSGYQASLGYTAANVSLSNLSSVNINTALNATAGNLALQTTTSGNITLTTAVAGGLVNILTGNLKVGSGTPGLTLNGDDAYITGTLEADGNADLGGTLTLGADVVLSRGAANRLDLASGDSLNLVSGSIQQNTTTRLTSAGLFQAADGAVGGPAYSFSNSTSMGMYRIDGNNLGFSVAGTERFRVSSTGAQVAGQLTVNSGDTLFTSSGLGNFRGSTISNLGDLNGRQLNSNSDFLEGLGGYNVYDNGSSGSISLSLQTDATAPNTAGRVMRLTHTAAGSPTPGWGGFYKGFSRCSDIAVGECYREGNRIVYRIWAKIPVGYTIDWASNSYGNSSSHTWYSTQAGTGQWQEYVAVQQIGSAGTFSSTGFWFISGSTRPVTWDVASVDIIDVDQAPDVARASELNVGYKRDVTLGAGQLLTTQATYLAVDGGNVGIGTTGPDAKLDVLSTAGAQLRLSYTDGSVYTDFTTDSSGNLTVAGSGSTVFINDILRAGTGGTLNIVDGAGDLYVQDELEVDGNSTIGGTLGVTGAITGSSTITGTQLISNIATGTAPLTVSSTTVVSNLNADLLDGYHAASMVKNQDGARYSTDLNTILNSGFYNAEAAPANAPDDYGQLIMARGIDTGMQIYGGYNGDLYYRGYGYGPNGGFYDWQHLWSNTNDGTGSGLDADQLDGLNSTAFALAGSGVTSLNSLAGALSIAGNSQIAVSASSPNINLSIQADSIGDSQLTYNTGQNLTTTSSVSFNDIALSSNINFSSTANKYIRFNSASSWQYYLANSNDDFRVYDSDSTDFMRMYYNGGTTNKYVSMLGTLNVKNNGRVGIGTNNPGYKLVVDGDHGNTQFLMHSAGDGGAVNTADLMLWASEPGSTYTGVGIANNMYNTTGFPRINTNRGGSMMRLLDNSIEFTTVNSSGTQLTGMALNGSGNVTIAGTLRVNGSGILNSSGYEVVQTNASDWLRINQNESFTSGTAAYGNWAFGTGGISVGSWGTAGAGNIQASGNITGSQLISTVSTGTAPLTVSSTTVVTNLNADYLDGYHASSFALTSGVVQLAPASAQTDSSTNSSIFINKTGASGNLLTLQKGASNVLTVGNTGATTFKNTADSATAFQIQNAAGTAFVTADSTNQQLSLRNKTDTATLGSDIFGADNNTCSGTNWTDVGVNMWQHTAGDGSALVCTSPSIATGTTYEITYTISGTTAGESFRPSIGFVSGLEIYGNVTNQTQVITTTTFTTSFLFSTTSAQTGTITIVSIKPITNSSTSLTIKDSTNAGVLEVRATGIGSSNLGIGLQSLQSNTTGYQNTASGYQSLYSNTTGYNNTALGYLSLQYNTSGASNTALGSHSLRVNTSGYSNTAVGVDSLINNTTGYQNTATGYRSLYSNTTGTNNTALGVKSLYSNISGSGNTASGYQSLYYNTTGYNNTAAGYESLRSNTTGIHNTASGFWSLYYNQTGSMNTAFGLNAGRGNGLTFSNFNNNSLYGYAAGMSLQTGGDNNILIGYQAGDAITTGASNILIGYNIDAQSATGSNQLSIGNVIFGGGGFGTGTTVGTGRIGIGGVEDGTDKLRVYGDVKVGTSGTNGCIKRFDGAALTGTCSSDERFKEEVTSMSGILSKVANLQAVTYKFNQLGKDYTGATGNEIQYGLIAQQVLQVAPELVSTDENGYLKLRYDLLPIYAIAAIGEQQTQITDAQDRLTALENSIQPASNNILDLTNGGTIQGNLNVIGNLNITGPVTMKSLTVTDDVVIAGNLTVQNITVANITLNGHIITAGNTPTATVGTAAGVEDTNNNIPAPQVTINGNDTAGTITIVAGANTTNGTLAEVSFNQAFGKAPKVVVTGQDMDSAGVTVFATPTANGFTFGTPQTAQPNKTYRYSYFVIE
jgi:hypothetical protein